MGRLGRLLFVATVVGAVGACTPVYIVQPQPAELLAEPATVAVLDHGRHSSLIVGLPNGRMVRYAYGDWRWYAQGDTGLGQGLAALFADTPAGLGRRVLPGPLTPETLRRQVRVGFADAMVLEVEGEAARRLVARLDAIAEAGRDCMVANAAADLDFFPHPVPYTMAHSSNRVVAQWLREIGVEVEGDGLLAHWRLRRQEESS
jgi:hypothetical protein